MNPVNLVSAAGTFFANIGAASMPLLGAAAASSTTSSNAASGGPDPAAAPSGAAGVGAAVPGGKPFQKWIKLFVDDSASMLPIASAVRQGINDLVKAHLGQPNVLISIEYLNGQILFDFCKPEDAVPMDGVNYDPQKSTPLYQNTPDALRRMDDAVKRVTQFEVGAFFYLLTDGENTGPGSPQDVKKVADRMILSGAHSVWGMAVEDGSTDFKKMFDAMGIPSQCVQVLKRAASNVREGFEDVTNVSHSATDAKTYRAATMRGFTQVMPQPPNPDPDTAPTHAKTAPAGREPSLSTPILARLPEEMGAVEREALLWSPFQHAFQRDLRSGWEKRIASNPLTWTQVGTGGFYELSAPPEGVWYVLGRFSGNFKNRFEEEIQKNVFLGSLPSLLFVPLIDTRHDKSPISGAHMLIGTPSSQRQILGVRSITTRVFPLSGAVSVLDPRSPQRDQEIDPVTGDVFLRGDERLFRLTPGVVIRVK